MANFCSNCGTALNGGKFCPECGMSVINQSVNNNDNEILEDIFISCGADKIKMCKLYSHETGVSLSEAKNAVDEFLMTKTFSEKCAANRQMQKNGRESAQQIFITKKGAEKHAANERISENKAQGIACCPKCGSTSLSANKKGFVMGKAVVGATLTLGVGLLAGAAGSKKIQVTCLNCGYKFKPGK